ncbi:hypothetical protein HYU40_04870 [Candidatus Woesearchaeota archaeon]|nr:hypothetical protein [Candidatus Woesearchaeota archaeon]
MEGKKRLLIAILLAAAVLLAALPVSEAASEAVTIFDGPVLAGYKYITTTGSQFSLVSVSPLSKVAIDFPGESLIVENKSCSAGRIFQACYSGAAFKWYNYSLADREVYEFSIKVSLVAAEFTVAKSVEKAQIDVGESTVVHVNITNAGSALGTARFSEAVPAQFKIAELPGQPCGLSLNNTLTMAADMKGGEAVHCDYKIIALSPGTYTLASAVSYDLIKTETAKATAAVAVNALPFSVVENISSSLFLGELLNISLLLKPGANLSLFVFSAFVPVQVKVFSVSREAVLARQAGGANVAYGDKTEVFRSDSLISISSQLAYAGTSVINTNSSWVYNGLEQSLVKDILINATLARPYLRATKYDSEAGKLSMDVVNPAHLSIYNVTVTSSGGMAAFSAVEIGSLGHASFSGTALTPSYTGAITYSTAYGQELSEPFNLSVNASNTIATTSVEANYTNRTVELPVNSTQGEIVKKPKPQPKDLMPAEMRTAIIMVGIIISIIIIFFAIRGRERGFAEENDSDKLK